MRAFIVGLFSFAVILTLFVSFVPEVAADGMVVPEPPIGYPEIEYHRVSVDINNQYAKTKVDQKFINPYESDMVGTYIFPVPEGASVSDFTMTMGGKTYETEIMDDETARTFFEDAVINHQDASLLEYIDQNILSCEVNIPAGAGREMILAYEELLTLNNGMYKYAYTLSTERYSSSDINDVSVTVNIKSDKGIETVYSPTHDISVERINAKQVQVKYFIENARPDTDFELYYTVSDDSIGAGMVTHTDSDEQGYFMFMFSPNLDHFEATTVPKNIVFVIDRSGSMSGDKIKQAKSALKYIVEELEFNDKFSIISFNGYINAYSEDLMDVNSTSIDKAITYIEGISADGGTNINDALLEGIDILGNYINSRQNIEGNDIPVIVFLTDGMPTAGVTNEETIVKNVNSANSESEVDAGIFVFGVGYDVNTHLLDKISSENHGVTIYVEPGESVESSMTEFYEKISAPVLTNIEIEYDGVTVSEVYPQEVPDLYKGSEAILVGKYSGSGLVTVKVSGTSPVGPVSLSYKFNVNDGSSADFIPRIWATRKVGDLLNQIRLEGETEELVNEVKALGFKYGIVTPYTSMMIQAEEGSDAEEMNEAYEGGGMEDKSGADSVKFSITAQNYSRTDKASIAVGANIVTSGSKTFVDVAGIYVEMSLLGGIETIELEGKSAEEWVNENIDIDKFVTFGSKEYFDLAADSALGEVLGVGNEVVFFYDDEVIAVTTGSLLLYINNINGNSKGSTFTITWETNKPSTSEVWYKEVSGSDWKSLSDTTLKTKHKIKIEGLEAGDYEFYIVSEDNDGNLSKKDNEGNYYSFSVTESSTSTSGPLSSNLPIIIIPSVIIIIVIIVMTVMVLSRSKDRGKRKDKNL